MLHSSNVRVSAAFVAVLLAASTPCAVEAFTVTQASGAPLIVASRYSSAADHRNRERRLASRYSSSSRLGAAAFELPVWDGELSDEDEELIRLIRGPLGAAVERPRPKTIVILSDTTGVTAKAAVEKSLVQFNGCDERYTSSTYYLQEPTDGDGNDINADEDCENLTTQIFPFVQREEEIAPILRRAGERSNNNALVVFTLSDPALRESTARMCELSGLAYVDLLGPMYDVMALFFDRQPLGASAHKRVTTNKRRVLSNDYYRRIEAVEFTLKCDDGRNPALLSQADVILLGVSRTGKTPLSVVLAQTMGLKVANVPLVVDLPPPPQLLDPKTINAKRVFVLMLNPDDLLKIRKTRIERELKNFAKSSSSSLHDKASTYADRQYLEADLKNARQVALAHGFTEIDVTGRAVEETASLVRSLLNDRFGDLIA